MVGAYLVADQDVCECESGEGRGAKFVLGDRGTGEGEKGGVRGEVFRDEFEGGGTEQAGERSEACKEPMDTERGDG